MSTCQTSTCPVSLRSTLLCLLLIASLSLPAFSQGWTTQTSGTTNVLRKVAFPDTNNGWAVGDAGTIVHTTNGGTTWASQNSGLTNHLLEVVFLDSNNGWAVGGLSGPGTIIHTTNGGMTWISQTSGTTNFLRGIAFTNANTGWVVGDRGTILHTTNGGSTWINQTSGTTNWLYGVAFSDVGNGWAVCDDGTIRHTTNGGTTWTSQTTGTTDFLCGVAFIDANNGWASGWSGIIVHTTNGGTTWTNQTSGTTNPLWSIAFINVNIGWAVSDSGMIVHTTNGGTTWLSQTSGTTNSLRGVAFYDASHGWAVGANGTILYYASSITVTRPNGGESFRIGRIDTIRWSSIGTTGNVRIELNRNYPSATWEMLFANTANDGQELWTVTGPSTPLARIRIRSITDTTIGDTSATNFTITDAPEINNYTFIGTLNRHYYYLSNFTSNWLQARDSCAARGGHLVSINSLVENQFIYNQTLVHDIWIGFTNNQPNGVWSWITGEQSTFTNWAAGEPNDYASFVAAHIWLGHSGGWADYPVTGPYVMKNCIEFDNIISLSRPNGGESFRIGMTDTIRWTSSNITGNVRIEVNRNYPTGTWETIIANTANDSIELWTVTGPSTPIARIRILAVNNPAIGDTSDGDFRIFLPGQNLISSLGFDGVSNYVEIPNSGAPQGNSDRTIEIWVKTSLNSGDNWFLHYGDTVATNTGVIFITNNGALGIAYYGNGWGVSYIGGNLWHHIALTYSSNHTNIYVDGTLIISDTQLPLNTVGSKIRLGIPLFSNGGRYCGLLSELRIWNYVRTQTQIQQNMFSNSSGTETGLVGYWRLNEGAGNTAYNDIPNGANGTIYSASWSNDIPRMIKLTSHNITAQHAIGALDTIRWISFGIPGNVYIDINRSYPSDTWENIISNTSNDGSQSWTVTSPYTATARLRITSVDTPLVSDTSDVSFVIGIVPATPGNLVVTIQGEDAQLSWSHVDTSISGFPITVQRYLVYFRVTGNTFWQFLSATYNPDSTAYTHRSVVTYSPSMYYQVTAWIGTGSTDSFDRIIRNIPVGTPKDEVMRRLTILDGRQSEPAAVRLK